MDRLRLPRVARLILDRPLRPLLAQAGRRRHALLLFLLAGASSLALAASSEFELPLSSPRFAEDSYTIAWLYSPASLVLADFDGDGNPDIAVFDSSTQQLFVQTVDAEGLLAQQGNQIAMQSDARGMAAEDVNGDGLADLVVANGTPKQVNVYLKQPDDPLNFRSAAPYAVGAEPVAVTLADVDGDGHPDIITANADDTVSILLNKGDGTFGAAEAFHVGPGPIKLAVADLDGDGHADIVTVGGSADDISVIMGKGHGSFGTHHEYPTGAGPAALAIGDLDGDGVPDVVVANTTDGNVSLLTGVGDGSFDPQAPLPTGADPVAVGLADSAGGGIHSVVTASSDGTVSVIIGDGHGNFAPHADYSMGDPVTTMATADMNADGLTDVVVAGTGGLNFNGNKTSIVYANDDGTLQAGKRVALGDLALGIGSGDFDHDGNQDIVVGVPNQGVAQIWLGDGKGGFAHGTDLTVSTGIQSIAVGDLDQDGNPDIAIVGGTGSMLVFLGKGDGTFTASSQNPIATGNMPYKVVIAEVNTADRFPDIVTGNQNDASVSVFLGNGDGTFRARQDFAAGGPVTDVDVGDLDGDRKPDIVTGNGSSASFSVLPGNGDGTFQGHQDHPADSRVGGIALGDLDEDGMLDVAVANNGTNVYGIYLGKGDGSFAAPVYYEANNGAGPANIQLIDMDGDGHLDLVNSVDGSDFVTVLFGSGDGRFHNEADAATGPMPQAFTIGDFDKSGTLDIAVAEEAGDSFRLIPATFMPPVVQSVTLQATTDAVYQGSLQSQSLSLDKNSITYDAITKPAHGSLSLNPDGTFSYTPAKGFQGQDTFSFQAQAHLHSGRATVAFDVSPAGSGGTGGGSTSGGGGGAFSLLSLAVLFGFAAARRRRG